MKIWLLCAVCATAPWLLLTGQSDDCLDLAELAEKSALDSDYFNCYTRQTEVMQCCERRSDWQGYFSAGLSALDCLFKNAQYKKYRHEHHLLSATYEIEKGKLSRQTSEIIHDALRLFEIVDLQHAGDTDTAIDSLEDLGRYYQHHPAYDTSVYYQQRMVQVMKMLAEACYAIGDYNQALVYNGRTLELAQPYYAEYSRDGVITDVLLNAAQCHAALGEHAAVESTFQEVRATAQLIDRKLRQRAFNAYTTLFTYYLEREAKDSAQAYLARLRDIDINRQYAADIHKMEGDWHWMNKEAEQARRSYQAALRIVREEQGEKSESAALCKLALGKLYLSTGLYSDAATMLQSALVAMSHAFSPHTSLDNPNLSDLYLHRDIPEILLLKSQALAAQVKPDSNRRTLDGAWNTARLAVSYVRELRMGYLAEEDKERVVERSYAIFEHTLDLAQTYYSTSGDASWVDSAFVLMEYSKSLSLLEAVLHEKARRFSGIPDSMRSNEAILRREIVGLEKTIRAHRKQPLSRHETLVQYQDALRQKMSEHRRLLRAFAEQHPKYFQLVHDTSAVSIDDVRSVLGPEQVLVEFFFGDRGLYTLAITRDSKTLHFGNHVDEISETITRYKRTFETYLATKSDSAVHVYVQTAHELYLSLLANLKIGKQRLLIVPDGPISDLSFASLLKSRDDSPYDLRALPYLLWDHDVAYCYSAKLYMELQESATTGRSEVLACAPVFHSEVPLPYNSMEAARVSQIVGGRTLAGEECTARRVMEILSGNRRFGILHLATHGKANMQEGEDSYVVLSGETDSTDSYIYARELYNSPLHVNMVFLGACESGSGEHQRGEGTVSLARAFFYAGARNIVTSLWDIEDRSALDLTTRVYQQLSSGVVKDHAIAEAQRKYLRELPAHQKVRAHPAYWAGLVSVGNTDPLPMKIAIPWGWALFLAACLTWCLWDAIGNNRLGRRD